MAEWRAAGESGEAAMARVVAYRVGLAVLLTVAFCLLWSLAYEVVVALRWAPSRFPGEGASRWALLRDAER